MEALAFRREAERIGDATLPRTSAVLHRRFLAASIDLGPARDPKAKAEMRRHLGGLEGRQGRYSQALDLSNLGLSTALAVDHLPEVVETLGSPSTPGCSRSSHRTRASSSSAGRPGA